MGNKLDVLGALRNMVPGRTINYQRPQGLRTPINTSFSKIGAIPPISNKGALMPTKATQMSQLKAYTPTQKPSNGIGVGG